VSTSPLVAAPTHILLSALWLLQAPTPFVLTTLAQYATTMKGRYGRCPSRQSLHKRMIDFVKGVCCSAHSLSGYTLSIGLPRTGFTLATRFSLLLATVSCVGVLKLPSCSVATVL
jgi:hypothetical protein